MIPIINPLAFPVTVLVLVKLMGPNTASYIEMSNDLGTLEPGKLADLLVFAENPLERIRVLTETELLESVVQGGVVVAGRLPAGEPAHVAG